MEVRDSLPVFQPCPSLHGGREFARVALAAAELVIGLYSALLCRGNSDSTNNAQALNTERVKHTEAKFLAVEQHYHWQDQLDGGDPLPDSDVNSD
eukprot:888312-Rhodomonas_salina.2